MYYVLLLLNIFLIEALLSVDNIAVLAMTVKDLPEKQQPLALKYGILGAFLFRGICLFSAQFLIKLWILKLIVACYLAHLTYAFFANQDKEQIGEDVRKSKIQVLIEKLIKNQLISTIVIVEILDLAFSLDNVFAITAMSNNIYVILTGVFMGIVVIRFFVIWFLSILKKHEIFKKVAFIVIGILSFKLLLSALNQCFNLRFDFIDSKLFDFIVSMFNMSLFVVSYFCKKPLKTKL